MGGQSGPRLATPAHPATPPPLDTLGITELAAATSALSGPRP